MRKLLMLSIGLLALAIAAPAFTQESKSTRKPAGSAIWKNERYFKQVGQAWDMISDERYTDAETRLRELVGRMSDPYEKSQTLYALASALMAQDKFDEGLRMFEQIVELNALDNRSHYNAMYQIAQLYYMRERYNDSLSWLDRWESEAGEEKPISAYEMRASIYAAQERFRLAIQSVDQAIAMYDKPPKEQWLQLKLSSHFELKEYRKSKEVLKQLINRSPDKKVYWKHLSSINVTLKQDQEALAVLALAHRKGMLSTESEWLQLYSLYGYQDMPYKAAKVLEDGISQGVVEPNKKNLEQMGNAWYAAHELDKAIAALTKAAGLATDGKLDMQVAYILVDKEDWTAAKQSLNGAISKGGLGDNQLGNMHVLLGMSEANTGNSAGAREAFRNALSFEKARSAAQQWLNHLDEQAKRARG